MSYKNNSRKPIAMVIVSLVIASLLLTACGTFQAAPKTPTIGVVIEVSIHTTTYEGFKAGMVELGYVEGENVTYIYNGVVAEPNAQTIDAEIENLLAQNVDMLLVVGNLAAARAKEAVAGTDTPVVFGAVTNPVGSGLVESISHPGGNLTGTQVGRELAKALEWLVKITPGGANKVYLPYNPDDEVSMMILAGLEEVPSQLGIELVPGEVHSVEEAVAAIKSLPEDVDAIYRIPSPTLDPKNNELSQAAIERGLPMGAGLPLDEAVLFTLAVDLSDVGKQTATLADKILKGANPADLPVETGEFYITINLKTAEAIGLDIPDSVLRLADTIIR